MGFRHYKTQSGDTRDAIKDGILFLADSAWSSKTMRFCYAVAAGVALIVANTNEEERLAPASTVLMETPGTGPLGGALQYLLDPHRQFKDIQNTTEEGK